MLIAFRVICAVSLPEASIALASCHLRAGKAIQPQRYFTCNTFLAVPGSPCPLSHRGVEHCLHIIWKALLLFEAGSFAWAPPPSLTRGVAAAPRLYMAGAPRRITRGSLKLRAVDLRVIKKKKKKQSRVHSKLTTLAAPRGRIFSDRYSFQFKNNCSGYLQKNGAFPRTR